jgi:alkylated DNA repair dioxygenase AlkB
MESVSFHIKNKFNIHGFSLFDILIEQEQFEYQHYFKRSVLRIDRDDFELYKHPIIIDLKNKIENEYGFRIKGIFVNLYKDGSNYTPYHKDTYGGTGIFTVSVGGSRQFSVKNDNSKEVTKYILEDGDLFYFNSKFNEENKHSITLTKKNVEPRISIVFFAE